MNIEDKKNLNEDTQINEKAKKSIMWGAAFLTATSTIGSGFLTQTAQFTQNLRLSFLIVVIVVVIINVFAQLNVWRILCISKMRAQDIANKILPGMGYFLATLMLLGSIAFNIGNIGGAALGFNVLFGLDLKLGYLLAGISAILVFLSKNVGTAIDKLAKILGIIMLFVIVYIAIVTNVSNSLNPTIELEYGKLVPDNMKTLLFPIITLIGGTIGGYILFSGGHRLIDANITGEENLSRIERSVISTLTLTTVIRIALFLACLGVVSKGITLDSSNPAASAFLHGAGNMGYKFFGIVILCAAVTSVVGSSYTTISFFKTLIPFVSSHEKYITIIIIAISTIIMAVMGSPANLLIVAGSLNGLIIPIALTMMLIASKRPDIVGNYKHPKWLFMIGVIIVIITSLVGLNSLSGIKALLM